jgi:hypothetical protein
MKNSKDCKLDSVVSEGTVDAILHLFQMLEVKSPPKPYYDYTGHKYLGVKNQKAPYGCIHCHPHGDHYFCDNHEVIEEWLRKKN